MLTGFRAAPTGSKDPDTARCFVLMVKVCYRTEGQPELTPAPALPLTSVPSRPTPPDSQMTEPLTTRCGLSAG
jgi:hypothetical protein